VLDLFEIEGMRMVVSSTGKSGVCDGGTILEFHRTNEFVAARYQGGSIVEGQLIGTLRGMTIDFRYVQADTQNNIDAGFSHEELNRLPDGRLQLTEHFQWYTRKESGTNVFVEMTT
jgi:hypothetical protein